MNAISKKLLSMLVVVAMVFSMVPFGGLSIFAVETYAEETETPDPATSGINAPLDFTISATYDCPACGAKNATWQPLTKITSATALTTGHYYVPAGGLTNSANYTITKLNTACIHLNGANLSSSTRVFTSGTSSELNIFGEGTVSGTGKGYGGAVAYVNVAATVNLHGGTFTAPNANNDGNPFKLENTGAKLNIYDGVTVSGKTRAIQLISGTVTMHGGTINGGAPTSGDGGAVTMAAGTFTMNDGTISGGTAVNGGNISVTGGTFTMNDGTISGGNATSAGGNISVAYATFTMNGGTVSNGTIPADTAGGGIFGGNIRCWKGTVNISGGYIYGGSAKTNNVRAEAANIGCLGESGAGSTLNISGGHIAGDILVDAYASVKLSGTPTIKKSLTLEDGTTTVNAKSAGMTFSTADSAASPFDISELQAGADIDLTGKLNDVFTVASDNAINVVGCFTPVNSELKVELQSDNTLKLVENVTGPTEDVFDPESFGGMAYCPVCGGEPVEWTVLPAATSANVTLTGGAHYYVPEGGVTSSLRYLVNTRGTETCIHLNDSTITGSAVMFNISSNATLNICGSGTVTGNAANTDAGCIGDIATGTINVYGGTYTSSTSKGSLFRLNGEYSNLNLYEGATLSSASTSVANGANVYMANGNFKMHGGTISGGTATSNGGNIYVAGGTFTMNDGTISGGKATTYGGNVSVTGGTFTMNDGTISGGEANRGGSVNVDGVTFNMTGGTIEGGTSTNQGGTMRVINSTVNLSGEANVYGGTGSSAAGIWLIDSALNMSGSAKVYGKGTTGNGNAVYATHSSKGSTVTLSGNATIKNATGASSNNLLINYNDTYNNKLIITNDWTGVAYLRMLKADETAFTRGEAVPTNRAEVGSITEGDFTAGGTFSGDLYYSPADNRPMAGKDGVLHLGLALITGPSGTTYYADYADALAAYKANNGFENGDYLKLASNAELVLNDQNVYVDSVGWGATVSGTGTLYAMDSANDDYVRSGTWTINSSDVTVVNDVTNPVNGNRYIVIRDAAGSADYHAHRVEIKLTHVSLRTSEAGLYYKSEYKCDAKLASRVSAWGVAVSTDVMPRGDFLEDYTNKIGFTCQETGFTPNAEHTLKGTSGSVFGIFKGTDAGRNAATNATYGKMKIYANAYFMVENEANEYQGDDLVVVGVTDTNKEVSYSLYDALVALDGMWTNLTEDQQTRVKDFYGEWKDLGMSAWANDFENIDA